MRALEKIGNPAVAEIERTLTPALLASGSPEDKRYVESAVLTLITIGGSVAAPVLIRAGLSAQDSRVRELAFNGVIQPWTGLSQERSTKLWEVCFTNDAPYACPFNDEAAGVGRAIRPLFGRIRIQLQRETDTPVRLAAASLLALWGEGAQKNLGERILLSIAGEPSHAYTQGSAIRMLGLLGVDAARDVIKRRTSAEEGFVKRAAAQALANLRDDGYVPIIVDLMKPLAAPDTPRQDRDYRKWAIEFAGRSHNLTFVPALIDVLDDRSWNGSMTTSTVNGRQVETRHAYGEDALAALRKITFQDFGSDRQRWLNWWAANRDIPSQTHLTRHVANLLSQLPAAQPWVMNEWVEPLTDADDPAVVPLLTAYFRHPRFDISQVGPNSFRGGGGTPDVLVLLLNLASQGSSEAKQILYECNDKSAYPLAIDCPGIVAVFDRPRATERLRTLMTGPLRYWAANALVQLGDARGIPALLDELESPQESNRSLAYRDLQHYTQQDIPYDPKASADSRKAAAAEWRRWWQQAGSTFEIRTRAARIDLYCCRV